MNSFAQQWQKLWIDSIPIWNAEHLTEHSDPDSSLDLVDTSSLVASGYKSIRLVTGEGGMEFRQDMRLGLQGEAAPGWFIDARLVDEGLHPGEVRATTLDQVDEMYLRIMNGRARLTLGNFQFIQDSLNLFSTQHSSMGAHFEWLGQKVAGQWAFGQDPMYRRSVVFQGRDGQRTGYLVAMDGVSDVAVVPGSDAVWLNGEKLRPGIDYWINPVGGLLDFIGLLLPGPRDEIRVEYEEYTDGGSRGFAAGQASLLLGSLKINLANSGMWADSSEVDSTGRRITPTDLRLSGARVEWDAKRWGGYFLEGAVSRTDSLESTWGQAARWGLHSERLWDDFHTGPRYEYFGTWMDSVYNGGEQGGSFLEWDPWNLRENWELNPEQFAAGQRRLDQVRLGFSLFESLLPWVGYGFRRVGDLTNSARIEGGLKHRSATATSQVNVASVTSYQAEKTERIDLKLETEQLTGRLRPFGKGRSIWRQGQYDLLSSAGFAYGGQEAWGGTFAVEAENILDSLHSAQVKNAFEFSGEAWSGSSLLQWKRSWDANSGGSENSWISEQKGTWEYGAHHGSVHHRLGLTQEQPLVPAYKRVMDGSGDVLFDSLTQRYVEGVDHGDFIQDGFVRQDSLAGRQQGEVYLRMEEWVSPGVLMGVDHGILRDLRFAFVGEWQKRDSVGAVYLPLGMERGASFHGGPLQHGRSGRMGSSRRMDLFFWIYRSLYGAFI